jgi:cation diffusion facilitator CzcD-associated flavoprotein CzcO
VSTIRTEHDVATDASAQTFDVLVVGAGFSGLYLLDRLREQGFSVHLVEAGAGIGGIWHWNCYPGARVDTTCNIYQFSRESLWRQWDWSERFPGFAEMRAYFEFVDQQRDLSRDISFDTRVRASRFDEQRRHWVVEAESGAGPVRLHANYMLVCTGFGSIPYTPAFEGLESFNGPCHHTGLWPQEGLDFTGQRVGVIGTGASGIQVAQEAGRSARELTVFQRTPNLCLPMQQQQLDAAANAGLRAGYPEDFATRRESFGGTDYLFDPRCALEASAAERQELYERLWAKGGFWFWLANFQDLLVDEAANRTAYDFWCEKVHARIADPATAELLAPREPPHPFGTKRPSLEQWYYDLFNEDHVNLVDIKKTPISRITPTGVVVGEHEYPFDVLVLATGFDAVTGGLTQIDIRGSDGSNLAQKWADGVRTYQGLANSGFPNLLVSYGPQAPTAFCNGPTSAEFQGEYIVEFLSYLREHNLSRIEATAEAEQSWREQCLELVKPTLFPKADSWYMGANIPGKKREILMYPGGLPMYMEALRQSAADGYAGFELS